MMAFSGLWVELAMKRPVSFWYGSLVLKGLALFDHQLRHFGAGRQGRQGEAEDERTAHDALLACARSYDRTPKW